MTGAHRNGKGWAKGKGHTQHGNGRGLGHKTHHGCPVNPCLLAGTWINTPRGPRLIEDLRVGDLVSTVDHGPQPLVHISRRAYSAADVAADRALVPYLFQPDRRDADEDGGWSIYVSKWHRLFMSHWSRSTPDGVLISAHHLSTARPDLCWQVSEWSAPVLWLNLYTERHSLIAADGITVESGWLGGAMAPRLMGDDWPALAHLAEAHRTNPARPFVEALAGLKDEFSSKWEAA